MTAPTGALYVSDLDFTLLRDDATLSPRTIEVINEVVARGHQFTYATSRSYTSASRVTRGLQLNLPLITYGGAVMIRPHDGAITAVRGLPEQAVTAIMRLTAEASAVEPLFFAMVDGRDRICWRQDRANKFVQSFLASRSDDPRLLPLADWQFIAPSSVFYTTLMETRSLGRTRRLD